jgi:hypothetical protein
VHPEVCLLHERRLPASSDRQGVPEAPLRLSAVPHSALPGTLYFPPRLLPRR